MAKQTAEPVLADDWAGFVAGYGRRRVATGGGRNVAEALVRPVASVIGREGLG